MRVGLFFRALGIKLLCFFGALVNIVLTYIANRYMLGLLPALTLGWLFGTLVHYVTSSEKHPSVFWLAEKKNLSDAKKRLVTSWGVEANDYTIMGCVQKLSDYVEACRESASFTPRVSLVECMLWSLDCMFDYSIVRGILSDGNENGAVAVFLFLFSWLIGSGGLVTAFISTAVGFESGAWRRWVRLLQGHTVILGWNDNVPTIITEHLESRRVLFLHKRRWAMPERIVVVTDYDIGEVRRRLRVLLHGHWLVTWSVYRGTYDDVAEIRCLNLRKAHAVIVLGEMNDPSHDAHVLLMPRRLCDVLEKCGQTLAPSLPIDLHLDSYGLYCQMLRASAGVSSSQASVNECAQNVSYHNFYDSWAKRLFANCHQIVELPDQDSSGVKLNRTWEGGDVHLVLVGFTEMGQALATQAALVAHYCTSNGTAVQTYVTVFDDALPTREREYRALFPNIDELPDVHWSFVEDVAVGSESFVRMVEGYAARSEQLTIAICVDDAAAGMKYAIPIMNVLYGLGKQKDVELLVRQDVHDRIMGKKGEVISEPQYGGRRLQVFGMRDGAGYNAWFRNRLVEQLYASSGSSPAEHFEYTGWLRWLIHWYKQIRHPQSCGITRQNRVDASHSATQFEYSCIADALEEMTTREHRIPYARALHNRWLAMCYLYPTGGRDGKADPDMVPVDKGNAERLFEKRRAEWAKMVKLCWPEQNS